MGLLVSAVVRFELTGFRDAARSCSSWLFGQTLVSDSFYPSVSDVEDSEGLPSLDKPGWYSQGNWPHLHELLKTMTGKPEPKVGQSP